MWMDTDTGPCAARRLHHQMAALACRRAPQRPTRACLKRKDRAGSYHLCLVVLFGGFGLYITFANFYGFSNTTLSYFA
jgi:hypothetical protein